MGVPPPCFVIIQTPQNTGVFSDSSVFVLAQCTDRGVPYGSKISIWRGLFQPVVLPLLLIVFMKLPLAPGGGGRRRTTGASVGE